MFEIVGDPIEHRASVRDAARRAGGRRSSAPPSSPPEDLAARSRSKRSSRRRVRRAAARAPESATPRSMLARSASLVAVSGSALMNGCTTSRKVLRREEHARQHPHRQHREVHQSRHALDRRRAATRSASPVRRTTARRRSMITADRERRRRASARRTATSDAPSSTTPSMVNSTNREIRYDARYSARDIGVATSRLSRFLPPLVDDREAEAPDAAAHDRHAEQTRARRNRCSAIRASRTCRSVDGSEVRPPGAALDGVVHHEARRARIRSRVVVLVRDAVDRRSARRRAPRARCAARRAALSGGMLFDRQARIAPQRIGERRRAAARRRPPPRERRPAASLRNAIPRPIARRIGKPNDQKSASGSRVYSLKRTVISCREEFVALASMPSSITHPQLTPGQRHEHVLESRRVRRELRELEPALGETTRAAPERCGGARRPGARSRRRARARRARRRVARSVASSSVRPVGVSAKSTTCSAPSDRDQLPRRAERDHFAVIDDRDAVAQNLGFVHVVRREHDRAAVRLEVGDQIPELAARLRIETGGRLVEKEQVGIADDRAREREPLLLSARQLADARRRAFRRAGRGE